MADTSIKLRHFIALHNRNLEFLSVCPKHVVNLGRMCHEVQESDTTPHSACDLCDLIDKNLDPDKLRLFEAHCIIVYPATRTV